ncbi:substrate-binding domain-containing protein [uncultured Cytophaga sp.]|uniref:substrate-binding domain-containing protein n=1 Tax=uncultured Cytophaga sp. TaxID=160238 RepID=UPI00261C4CEB|nr:substrate-binding domain-containing protein [uncultured Cytophaga sp.]
MTSRIKNSSLFVLLLFTISCSKQEVKEGQIESKKERIEIVCDPSWELILRTFISTYEGLNPTREVELSIKPESECIEDVLNGKNVTAFVSRELNTAERNFVTSQKWNVYIDTICYDGITWIVPKSFPEDSLSLSQVKELFLTGMLKGKSYSIQLNDIGSSIANYLIKDFGKPTSIKHIYKGGSDAEIIASVQTHNSSIGCISSSTLVNLENKKNRANLESIKILKISSTKNEPAFSSFQNDLALGRYPFIRVLRVINHDAQTGLGTAFVSFMKHNRGQRLILKEGLLPFRMPGREVEMKNQ